MRSFETQRKYVKRRIYNVNDEDFDTVALEVFQFQYHYNPLYNTYCHVLAVNPHTVSAVKDIPFLPVTFFRDQDVRTGVWNPVTTFRSSGTTGVKQSAHHVRDLGWYHQVAEMCFSSRFGAPENYRWLGLLPSYLERPDSSLVDMVNFFIQKSGFALNGFFPLISEKFLNALEQLSMSRSPTILVGVSFALLDLLELYQIPVWEDLHVIETGGMKGRREEITRPELHARMLLKHPGLNISSEYGMTEMMSQAYLSGEYFTCGPTMKVLMRDISDPFQFVSPLQRGVINVIDLGNIDSCAFIATDDVGVLQPGGSFDVLGRLDQSDMRGCNLMYT